MGRRYEGKSIRLKKEEKELETEEEGRREGRREKS